jgi:hypothetical protein
MSGVKTQGHAVLGQYRIGAFMLTPPIRARLANEPRLSDRVRRPRKAKAKHAVRKQIAAFQPTDVALAYAKQRTAEFFSDNNWGLSLPIR